MTNALTLSKTKITKQAATLPSNPVDTSDAQILKLIAQGLTRERGYRLLLEKYQERLYWHIRRMVINHEDANDVVQNSLIKVFRSIHQFKGNARLYTWLYRIATNEAITYLNQQKRRAVHSIDEEESAAARQLEADSWFDGDEAQRQLQHALLTLPDKQRLVFNLRYFEEMPYKEIAQVLDTSVGGLKASYHHAVKKIESYLTQAS